MKSSSRLSVITLVLLTMMSIGGRAIAADSPPNFVLIFTDDQGYQDLGCFGSPLIKTPHIDRMAEEGMRMTCFYAQTVCGPSRGALMTGSYVMRLRGTGWRTAGEEVMIPEVLKQVGYRTGCFGKWDMSQRRVIEGLMPNDQGFDEYFGAIGANDGGKVELWHNRQPVRVTDDMGELTGLYTDKAIGFIRANRNRPFFVYLAHTMPHVKIDASREFRGKSAGGLYGDVIEEIDHNVGRVLGELRTLGLDDNSYVVFTSDNGPWLPFKELGGSAEPLRMGKGSAWEGGFRVPTVVWGPGRVPAGKSTDAMMATIDLLPTFASLAGAPLPTNRVIDGRDQSALIKGTTDRSARETFFYYVGGNIQIQRDGEPQADNPWLLDRSTENLHAVRKGRWKLAVPRKRFWSFARDATPVTEPELYDLQSDVSERHNVAAEHPRVVAELLALADQTRERLGDLERTGTESRDSQAPSR